jgi:hypothetical protein
MGQQTPVPGYRLAYSRGAEGQPHHGSGTGQDGLAKVLFEHVKDGQSRQSGTADEYRLRLRSIDLSCQTVGPFSGLLINVMDILETAVSDHL